MGQVEIKRVTIDTNVVVSGLLFGGTAGSVVTLWKRKGIRPFASKDIINEYVRVLAYPKFELSENEIEYLIYEEIVPYFDVTSVKRIMPIVKNDPSDDKFIACALASNSKFMISGDRHLLEIKTYQDIDILSPHQFLKLGNR